MSDNAASLNTLFKKQPDGDYMSERDYISDFRRGVDLLRRLKPSSSELTDNNLQTILISFQEDHGLPLREIIRRLPTIFELNTP